MDVKFVKRLSAAELLQLTTGVFIQVKSHTNVTFLKRLSAKDITQIAIKEFIQEKSHMNAIFIKKSSVTIAPQLNIDSYTGEKPYSCNICHKSFSKNSNLSKHCKTSAHLKRKERKNSDSSSQQNNAVVDEIDIIEQKIEIDD